MTVKVVTDSTSDIPPDLAEELGIRVVPIYIRFGSTVYRDGVDIRNEDFYRMLAEAGVHPATSQPTPEDFENAYNEFCGGVEGIVSIHISSKISGTCNSAAIARENLESRCPIEVVDSGLNSAGLAIVALAAARLAASGATLAAVVSETRKALEETRMFGMFETMNYLARSGRVNRAISTVANVLNVMPLLTFHEGEIVRAGLVRSVSKGMDHLYRFVEEKANLTELVIVHSMVPEQAEALKKRLAWLFPEVAIRVMEMGAGLGVHGGPGVMLVGTREEA